MMQGDSDPNSAHPPSGASGAFARAPGRGDLPRRARLAAGSRGHHVEAAILNRLESFRGQRDHVHRPPPVSDRVIWNRASRNGGTGFGICGVSMRRAERRRGRLAGRVAIL